MSRFSTWAAAKSTHDFPWWSCHWATIWQLFLRINQTSCMVYKIFQKFYRNGPCKARNSIRKFFCCFSEGWYGKWHGFLIKRVKKLLLQNLVNCYISHKIWWKLHVVSLSIKNWPTKRTCCSDLSSMVLCFKPIFWAHDAFNSLACPAQQLLTTRIIRVFR